MTKWWHGWLVALGLLFLVGLVIAEWVYLWQQLPHQFVWFAWGFLAGAFTVTMSKDGPRAKE